jgi:hypothetical protein
MQTDTATGMKNRMPKIASNRIETVIRMSSLLRFYLWAMANIRYDLLICGNPPAAHHEEPAQRSLAAKQY